MKGKGNAMTTKEIERNIRKEENFAKRAKERILELKDAIECSRNAVHMWKRELRRISDEQESAKVSLVVVEDGTGITLSRDRCKSKGELEATFRDAYRYHVGRNPTENAVRAFLEKGGVSAKNGVKYSFLAV